MQVKTAMIVMAIMGCDDSATTCTQLSLSEPRWETVAACDKDSEQELARFSNAKYPMVIAICQSPEVGKAEAMQDNAIHQPQQAPPQQTPTQPSQPSETASQQAPKPNLLERTFGAIKEAIPTTDGIKQTVGKPVHVIADGYSWVVRKIAPE